MSNKSCVLHFNGPLFINDRYDETISKKSIRFNYDYLIEMGGYSGKIARCIDKRKPIKQWCLFKDFRNREIRIRVDKLGL